MTSLRVTAIAAMARHRVIGTGDAIPWNLPGDRRHFRAYTAGKALLLGRRTFEEMLGWFADHRPIVLTSKESYHNPAAAAVVTSVADAITTATAWSEPELVVCGGAATYAAALPHTTDAILTEIDTPVSGSARFPELPPGDWKITAKTNHPVSDTNPLPFAIVHYTRR